MDTAIFAQTKNKNKTYREISFFYSTWFTVALSVFVYLFWILDLGLYGLTVLIVLAGAICALCKDLSPLIPIMFLFLQCVSDVMNAANAYVFYICAFSLLIVGIVIHFIRFNPYKNYGKIKGFSVATAFVGLSIILGGITLSSERSLFPALITVFYGILATGSGFFFCITLGQNNEKRLTKTVMNAILAASAVAFVQLLTVIFQSDNPLSAIGSKYALNTGYGHPNYIANIIARSLPICIYLSVSNKKYSFLWLVAAFVCGASIILTRSRATILIAFIISVVCLIYFFPKLDYKINWVCTLAMLIGLSFILIAAFSNRIVPLFKTIIERGFSSSGRTDLWKLGLHRFKENPIFGVGLDYDLGGRTELNPTNTPYTPFWYHNTVVQILCSLGIFGLIAYGFYFYRQYHAFALAKSPALKTLMFVLITIQAISLLDIFFLTPQEFLQMIFITVPAVRALSQDKDNTLFYDVANKIKLIKTKRRQL